jgi:hypothetical protein
MTPCACRITDASDDAAVERLLEQRADTPPFAIFFVPSHTRASAFVT